MKIAICKLNIEDVGRRAQGADYIPDRLRPESVAPRPGFTLVELLVVIAILSIVTVASIPFVIPALNSRAVREAARMVNTQFAAAQAQAMATGRSVGVWMERLPGEPTGSMDLFLAEVPPPYAGQDVNETVNVKIPLGPGTPSVTFSNSAFYPLLRPGDLIRFNNSGPYYVLGDDSANPSVKDPNDDSATVLTNVQTSAGPPPAWTKTIMYLPTDNHYRCPPKAFTAAGWDTSYQVFRQPVKSIASAVQLPTGAVIDLIDSGVGNYLLYQSIPNNVMGINPTSNPPPHSQANDDNRLKIFTVDPVTSTANMRAVVFIFKSSGELDSLCFNITQPTSWNGTRQTTAPVALTSPLYLMIGKREKLFQKVGANYDPTYYDISENAAKQAEKHNFRDLENLWVCINPQSGLTTTAEVADIVDSAITGSTTHEVLQNAVVGSRKFSQSAQATGGR